MLLIFDLFSKFETCPYCQMWMKIIDGNTNRKNMNLEKVAKTVETSHNKKTCFILSTETADFEEFDSREINNMARNAWKKINELIKERDEFKNNLRKHKK